MKNNLISFLPNIYDSSRFKLVQLGQALSAIKSGKYKQQIIKLRAIDKSDKEKIKREKGKLPAFSFSGTFTDKINNNTFHESSGLFCFDIDKLESDDIYEAKKEISTIPGVVFCFVSPGGLGLKSAVRIKAEEIKDDLDFKRVFLYMQDFFAEFGFTIDKSCCDIRRLCYVSYDPEIYINYDAEILAIPKQEPKPEPVKSTKNTNNGDTEAICLARLNAKLSTSADGERHFDRLTTAVLAGGYIAGGLIDEPTAFNCLLSLSDSISSKGNTTKGELKTLRDGIEKGKQTPIYSLFREPIQQKFVDIKRKPENLPELTPCLLDFLPESHLMARMTRQVAKETNLPVNTVFLMGLSVFSSVASRVYCTAYQSGARLPIGLYAVAEQPPGSAKTWCLSIFQKPFYEYRQTVETLDDDKPALFISNATAEGLEVTLSASKGFFSAISSEQGLFNSLFGSSYTASDRANNNDISLSGFDGGYVNSKRVSRKGYEGRVCGAITCFAQDGSIEGILKASSGTGLAERFLMLAEPHNLGSRDHTKKVWHDFELYDEYKAACGFSVIALSSPSELEDLHVLEISEAGFDEINQYRNKIEAELGDDGKFSHYSMRGSAGKINIQIMKIAASLHLLSGSQGTIIDDNAIISALGIADALLNANLSLCVEKGIMGLNSEFSAIIAYLEKAHRGKTEQEIINSLKSTKPFKDVSGSKAKAIRATIEKMTEKRMLQALVDVNGRILFSVA